MFYKGCEASSTCTFNIVLWFFLLPLSRSIATNTPVPIQGLSLSFEKESVFHRATTARSHAKLLNHPNVNYTNRPDGRVRLACKRKKNYIYFNTVVIYYIYCVNHVLYITEFARNFVLFCTIM